MFGDKPEWEAQLNLYRLLYEEAGFPVNGMEIHAILRDWHQSKVNGNGYPEIPFKKVSIPMWDKKIAWDYLEERVRLHLLSDQLVDEELPPCSSDEKWERAEKFAVMKKGQKRAVRLLDTEHEAENYLSEISVEIKGKGNKGNGYYIQHRPGEAVRCNSYCRVKSFCKQYQRESVEF